MQSSLDLLTVRHEQLNTSDRFTHEGEGFFSSLFKVKQLPISTARLGCCHSQTGQLPTILHLQVLWMNKLRAKCGLRFLHIKHAVS